MGLHCADSSLDHYGFVGLVSIGTSGARAQGFKHLLRSIMMHVLETRVDILVRGAWLCTSTAHDANHHAHTHIRLIARRIGLHQLTEVRVCRL